MNKLSVTALAVTAVLSTSAFAGKNDELQLELYGKVGFTQDQTEDLKSGYDKELGNGKYDRIVQDDWTAYRDTRLGLKAGLRMGKNFSVHAEGQLDYEAQEVRFDLKEAYLLGKKKQFSVEAGRMRTPLFMHSEIQDDDFAMNTYKENIFFSTRNTPWETFDGASVGYEQKFSNGTLELNALYGVAKDREDVYFSFEDDMAVDVEYIDIDQLVQVEALYKTKYGFLRGAHTIMESDDDSLSVTGLGFQQQISAFVFESEAALYQSDDVEEVLDWRALLSYDAYVVKPYAQYASRQIDGEDGKNESVDFGLNYEFSKYATLKASYELVTNDAKDYEDEIVSIGLGFKY